MKEGDEGVKEGDAGVKEGDEGMKEDEGAKEGDEVLKKGDKGVKEGDEGVKDRNVGVKEEGEVVKTLITSSIYGYLPDPDPNQSSRRPEPYCSIYVLRPGMDSDPKCMICSTHQIR